MKSETELLESPESAPSPAQQRIMLESQKNEAASGDAPRRHGRWAALWRRLRPLAWLIAAARLVATVIDAQDAVYLLATGLVVRGTWTLFGEGWGSIAAGAMLAFPPVICLLKTNRKGDKK